MNFDLNGYFYPSNFIPGFLLWFISCLNTFAFKEFSKSWWLIGTLPPDFFHVWGVCFCFILWRTWLGTKFLGHTLFPSELGRYCFIVSWINYCEKVQGRSNSLPPLFFLETWMFFFLLQVLKEIRILIALIPNQLFQLCDMLFLPEKSITLWFQDNFFVSCLWVVFLFHLFTSLFQSHQRIIFALFYVFRLLSSF